MIFFNNIGEKSWDFKYWKEQEKLYWVLNIGCYFFTDLVIVNYENIAENGQYNFDVLNYETYGLLYDWKSITHYRNKAFRKENVFGYTIESNVS